MKKPRLVDFEFGRNIYEKGFFQEGFFNYYEAFGLSQYLIWSLGYGYQRTRTYLIEFSKKCDNSFNEIKNLDKVKEIVRRAEKKQPDNFPTIAITEAELRNIEKIKNFKYQKFLFSLLVYAKRNKFDLTKLNKQKDTLGYHISKKLANNITTDMGLKISLSNMAIFLNEFYLINLIEFSDGERILVLFAEDNSKPIIEIKGIELPWIKYLELFNNCEQIYCLNCEKLTERKFNHQKYCDECKKIVRLEKEKLRMRNVRKIL